MSNSANEKSKTVLPADFRPMSSPTQQLAVPEREGYHRRWFRSDPRRIQNAQRAGYTFVDPDDVSVKNSDLGGDARESGNTDLGSRVSVIAGGIDTAGQPERMYLMEVPLELYEMSRKVIEDKNDAVAAALKGGYAPADQAERSARYMKGNSNLFDKKN